MVSNNQSGDLKTMTMCENIVKKKLKIRIPLKKVETEPIIESSEFCQRMLHYSDDSKLQPTATFKVKLPTRPSNKRGPLGMLDGHKEKRLKMDRSVKQQCSSILKALMTHPAGWVFNKPVDPVELNIPDYFSIVTEPMDLGTIKTKLEDYMYFTVEEFAADVRLTFSNAMLYNPPSNNVHLMAKELDNIFSSRWKSLQSRVSCESRIKNSQEMKQLAHKKSPTSVPKISLSCEEKIKLRKDIVQASSGNMTEKLRSFLQKFGLICGKEEKLEMNIDALDGETVWGLKRLIKDSLDAREAKADNVKMGEKGRRQFPGKVIHKVSGNKSACGFADAKPSLSLVDHAYASSGDLSSERAVGQSQCAYKKDYEEKNMLTSRVNKSDKASDRAISSLDEEIICSTPPHSIPITAASGEGSSPAIDIQLSPKRALRAAMLKSRFAETIFKAKQKTLLDNVKKDDPVRMQQEKERLERQQQEEKARIDAQIRAAEAASRLKTEEELKTQREREREAARIALQKMEKTAEIDDSIELLKDLEMLRGSVFDAIEGGSIGNPLELLGLFMKDEFLGDETDDENDEERPIVNGGENEEGELFS